MILNNNQNLTTEQVVERVRQIVQGRHPGGVSLEVSESETRQRDGWWHIVVRPSQWPNKRYEYYEELAEIENDLQEKEHLNVLIATGEPASDTVASLI